MYNGGQITEIIIPYAQSENLDVSSWAYNSHLSQRHFTAHPELGGWYVTADDNYNIEYPDFEEAFSPYHGLQDGDFFPKYNAPLSAPIKYDFKAYHYDDHLYRPFARDVYEKFGIQTPTDRFPGDDPQPITAHSRIYYNRELRDLRGTHEYSYDMRFTILDDIKYGKLAPTVISRYMRHLYSDVQQRKGVAKDDDIF